MYLLYIGYVAACCVRRFDGYNNLLRMFDHITLKVSTYLQLTSTLLVFKQSQKK